MNSDSPTTNSKTSEETTISEETEKAATISDLLSSDPELLTVEDAMTIAKFLRERREQWEAAEGTAKRSGTRTPRKAGTGVKSSQIPLDDLLGDIEV